MYLYYTKKGGDVNLIESQEGGVRRIRRIAAESEFYSKGYAVTEYVRSASS